LAGWSNDAIQKRKGHDVGRRFPDSDDGALAGVIKPGTVYNDIISLLDWFPTLCAAAGVPDIKEQMTRGFSAHGKKFKVHLDGYNFLPYFQGKEKMGLCEVIYYFNQNKNLNTIH